MKINKRYQTHPIIKEEMLKLLKWARDNDVNQIHETPEQKLDQYFAERDIAISGQSIAIIEKVSTRNAVKETILLTVLIIGSVLLALGIGIAIQIWK